MGRPAVLALFVGVSLGVGVVVLDGPSGDFEVQSACAESQCPPDILSTLQQLDVDIRRLVRDGEQAKLERASIHANLERVRTRIGHPVYQNPQTGETYEFWGSMCGSTAAVTGAVGGFVAAKDLCEASCADPGAHVCESNELARYLGGGGTPPAVEHWIVTGSGGAATADGRVLSDCAGWVSADGAQHAAHTINGAVFGSRHCDASLPMACCL